MFFFLAGTRLLKRIESMQKNEACNSSLYPIKTFKELYNKLPAIKIVLQNLLGNLRIFRVQTVCFKTT